MKTPIYRNILETPILRNISKTHKFRVGLKIKIRLWLLELPGTYDRHTYEYSYQGNSESKQS